MIQRITPSHRALTAIFLALGLAFTGSATAGDASQGSSGGNDAASQSKQGESGQKQGQSGQQGKPVTDDQLKKFAQAYSNIRTVRSQYQRKLQQAKSKDEKAKLKKEGRRKMMGAIQDAGLDVAEYQRIGKELNKDKALQKRLQKMMVQQGSKSGSGSGGSASGSSSSN